MGRVKLINGYKTEGDVANLISYILYPAKSLCQVRGGNNILAKNNLYDTNSIVKQFHIIQRYAGLEFRVRAYQVTYDFDPDLDVGKYKLIAGIADAICRYYSDYQAIYAIHDNTRILHLHLCINNIPVYGNKQLSCRIDYFTLNLIASIAECICLYSNNLKRETASSITESTLDILYKYQHKSLSWDEWNLYIGDPISRNVYYGL